MAQPEQPQIYLITPPQFDLSVFPPTLAGLLDAHAVACVRLSLAGSDEDTIARAGDALRGVAHARDVALVVADHVAFVGRLGLDGVHLTDGARSVRSVRGDLGGDAIIGTFCGASRHDGLNAAEAGADYVAFGPVRVTPLGHATPAMPDLFAWWSEVIEVPIVAEGAVDIDTARALAPVIDFLALGDEIWAADDPSARLGDYLAAIT